MRQLLKRVIPILVSILMVVSLLPQIALAEEGDEQESLLTDFTIYDLTIPEYTCGTIDGQNGYYYDPLQSEDLTVELSYGPDGIYSSWEDAISFLEEKSGETVEYTLITGQDEEPWLSGYTYPAQVELMGQTATFYVTIEKYIQDFQGDNQITLHEGRDGYWNEEEGYFVYSPRNLDNLYLLIKVNGNTYSGDWDELQYQLLDNVSTFEFTGQSAQAPWTKGNTYESTLRIGLGGHYGFAEYPVYVTIEENPYSDFSISDISVIENSVGSWHNEGTANEFFYYYVDSLNPQISLTYKGVTYTGTIWDVNNDIYDATGEYLSLGQQLIMESGQSATSPWLAGHSYPVTATLLGMSTTFQVSIIENPLTSFSIEDLSVIVNTGGTEMTDYGEDGETETYYYYEPIYADNLKITIVYDGVTYTGNDSTISETIRNLTGQYYNFNVTGMNQENVHWVEGGTYPVKVTFMGKSTQFNVSIIPNPLSQITIGDIQLIENASGYYTYDYDHEAGGTTPQYFSYYLNNLPVSIVYNDITYSGTLNQIQEKLKELNGAYPSFTYTPKQSYNNQWEAGETYELTGSLLNISDTFKVTIKENPLSSITIEDAEYYPYSNGYYSGYRKEGSNERFYYFEYDPAYLNMTIVYDGVTYSGTYREIGEKLQELTGQYPQVYFSPRQDENNLWTEGNTYDVTATLMGKTADYKVTILESPIASVTADDISFLENTNGFETKDYDWNTGAETPFYYRYDFYNVNMTVVMKNGDAYSGRCGDIEQQIYQATGCRPNFRVEPDQSFTNQWTVGNTYHVTGNLMGKEVSFNVSIVDSPLTAVEVGDYEVLENTNGHIAYEVYDPSMQGGENPYYYYELYNMPMAIVYNGERIDGTLRTIQEFLSSETGDWESVELLPYQDYYNQWKGGNTYDVTARIMGVESNPFKVTIKKMPLTFVSFDDAEVIEYTNGYYRDDMGGMTPGSAGINFYYYNLSGFVNMTVVYDGQTYSGPVGYIMSTLYDLTGQWMDVQFTPYQSPNNQWSAENTYTVTGTFNGLSDTFNVTVKKSLVSSLTIEDMEIIEATSGYISGDYDPMTGVETNTYFHYNPNYDGLVKLSVVYDGKTYSGTFREVQAALRQDTGNTVTLELSCNNSSEQSGQNPWTVGNTYTVTGTLLGAETTFKVKIVPNELESVTVSDIEILEETGGNWYSTPDGGRYYSYDYISKITPSVTYGGKVYTGNVAQLEQQLSEVIGTHVWFSYTSSQSFTNQWTAGNTYDASVTFMNTTVPFKVTIISSATPTSMQPKAGRNITLYSQCAYRPSQLAVTYAPSNAKQQTKWTSADTSIINIDESITDPEPYIAPLKAGTTTVTATSIANPSLSQTFTVTVLDGEPPVGSYTTEVYYGEVDAVGSFPVNTIKDPKTINMDIGDVIYLEVCFTAKDLVPLPQKIKLEGQSKYVNTQYLGGGISHPGYDFSITLSYFTEAKTEGTQIFQLGNNYTLKLVIGDGGPPYGDITGLVENENGQLIYVKNGVPDTTKNDILSYKGDWYCIKNGVVDPTLDSVEKNANGWWCIHDGKVDFNYTGFEKNANGWWYCEKGQVNFQKNDILPGVANTDPTAEGIDGWWYVKGSQVTKITTVASNKNGWWYVKDGMVDFGYTGVQKNDNGWWYIHNGQVNFNYTGFAANEFGWWYCESGQVKFNKNDILSGKANTDPAAAGVDGWWYIKGSQVTKITTVASNANGWWFVKDGKVDFDYTGVQKNDNGWWYINKGQVKFDYNGFAKNEYGWWYCESGQVKFNKNDVISGKANSDPALEGEDGWWNVKNSQVIKGPSVEKNANGWWYIDESGKVDFTFTGLADNEYGTWYCVNGKVDFNYTESFEGRSIVNGKAS